MSKYSLTGKWPAYCLIFLLALVFTARQAGAQTQEVREGRIRYLVVHNWAKKMAAVDYLSKQQKEKIAYMAGNRAEWKLYTELFFSPTLTKYQDSEEKAEPEMEGWSWRPEAFFIQRNFANNTTHDVINMLGKNYIIEDSMYVQDWKILNDMKEVAGHVCMNASWEDTLKHQNVIAWFALDMPISGGPERFCGLPGMILEVDVNNGAMVITADKIETTPPGANLELPKKIKGKKIHEADYREMLHKYMEEKRKAEEPYFWGIRY